MNYEELRQGLISYLIVISSLTLHEWGHAATADNLGDDTPRRMGRVTINPLAHLDLIGTVLLPLISIFSGVSLIGWAKPVIINPNNLKKVSDRAWVTLAGPGMNLILAAAAAVTLGLLGKGHPELRELFVSVMLINVSLMVFNLLPVPPLDGSKFLMYWFGMKQETYAQFSRFGWIILMVLFNVPQARLWFGGLIQEASKPFLALIQLVS